MEKREIRGHVINRYLAFIKKTWGKDGYDQVLKDCGLEKIKIMDSKFYDNAIMERILQWISSNHGMHRVRQGGNFTAQNMGMLSYMVRFMSMEKMLHKAEERFKELYKFGDIKIELGENSAVVTMTDVSGIPENCEGWLGVIDAMMELTKTKGTVEHTQCQMEGEQKCVYTIRW